MKEVKGFRIGDRVRATLESIYGMTGTVIGFDKSYFSDDPEPMLIMIEFDKEHSLFHSAGGKGKEGHCYKLYPSNIEKLDDIVRPSGEKPAEETITTGDRVFCKGYTFSGNATVVYAYDNGDYCVRMDDRSLGWSVFEEDETYRKRGLEVGGGYWNARATDLTPSLAEMPKTDRSPRTIVIRITDDGATAKYMNGKTVEKTAEVRRYHEDKPDDEAAAVYAIAKLFGRTARKKNEFEVSAEWASKTADILRGMDWNDILFKAFAEKK